VHYFGSNTQNFVIKLEFRFIYVIGSNGELCQMGVEYLSLLQAGGGIVQAKFMDLSRRPHFSPSLWLRELYGEVLQQTGLALLKDSDLLIESGFRPCRRNVDLEVDPKNWYNPPEPSLNS
jgi:hypothetical protein